MSTITGPLDYHNACRQMMESLRAHLKSYNFINDIKVDNLIKNDSCVKNLTRKKVANSDKTTSQEYGYLISDLITPLTYTNVSGFDSLQKKNEVVKQIIDEELTPGSEWYKKIQEQLSFFCKNAFYKDNKIDKFLILCSEDYDKGENPSPENNNIASIQIKDLNFLSIDDEDFEIFNTDNLEKTMNNIFNKNEFKIFSYDSESGLIPEKKDYQKHLNLIPSKQTHTVLKKKTKKDDEVCFQKGSIEKIYKKNKSIIINNESITINKYILKSPIFHSYTEHIVDGITYYIINIHNDSGKTSVEAAQKIIRFINSFAEQIAQEKNEDKEEVKKKIIIGGDSNVYYSTVTDDKFNTGLTTLYEGLKETHFIWISKNIITKTRPCNFFMNAQTMTKSEVNIEETMFLCIPNDLIFTPVDNELYIKLDDTNISKIIDEFNKDLIQAFNGAFSYQKDTNTETKLDTSYFNTKILSDHIPMMGTIEFNKSNKLFVIFSNNLSIQGKRGLNKKSTIFKASSSPDGIQKMSDDLIPKVINLLIDIVYSKHSPKLSHLDESKNMVNDDNRDPYKKLMKALSKVNFKTDETIDGDSLENILAAYNNVDIKKKVTQGGRRRTLRQNRLNFRRKTLKRKLSKKRKKNNSRKNKSRKNK